MKISRKKIIVFSTCLLLLMSIVGCQSKISFTTLESGEDANYGLRKPLLFIISSKNELSQIPTSILSSGQVKPLNELDYEHHFAIVIFYGPRLPDESLYKVDRITKEKDQVIIEVVPETAPTNNKSNNSISPYEIISIEKGVLSKSTYSFLLKALIMVKTPSP